MTEENKKIFLDEVDKRNPTSKQIFYDTIKVLAFPILIAMVSAFSIGTAYLILRIMDKQDVQIAFDAKLSEKMDTIDESIHKTMSWEKGVRTVQVGQLNNQIYNIKQALFNHSINIPPIKEDNSSSSSNNTPSALLPNNELTLAKNKQLLNQ